MSKTTKKQSLLSKQPVKRNTVKKATKAKTNRPNSAEPTNQQNKTHSDSEDKRSKKGLLITIAIIMLGILITPKPTLLSYKKLGLVSESIYWPGVFGYGSTLFDSNLYPKLDSRGKSLYLCANKEQPKSCQKYLIVEDKGIVGAFTYHFKH
jgi:hypothetical protein